jgi:hypothetical protein
VIRNFPALDLGQGDSAQTIRRNKENPARLGRRLGPGPLTITKRGADETGHTIVAADPIYWL